ncbi:unnamed protein product [Tenebrio molitor]|nr:unnamed protein product [Tenebrio molitor]
MPRIEFIRNFDKSLLIHREKKYDVPLQKLSMTSLCENGKRSN